MNKMHEMMRQMHESASAPAEVIRGPDGRIAGVRRGKTVRNVQRGPDGSVIGIQ